ncbi:unnamed protein product, partial [Prorocentrum cordatum]
DILELFGKWFVQDLPDASAIANFEDATTRRQDGPIQKIQKGIANKCYTHLPVQLDRKPSDDTLERWRRVLCTTYAGRPDAGEIGENMEVLAESVVKNCISGATLPCRSNFRTEALYLSWGCCAIYWELNPALPSIVGDPSDVNSLRSWARRFIVLKLESQFTPDENNVDVASRCFLEGPSLEHFLETQEARYAYVRYSMLPRRMKYSRKAMLTTLINVNDRVKADTVAFVKRMAN